MLTASMNRPSSGCRKPRKPRNISTATPTNETIDAVVESDIDRRISSFSKTGMPVSRMRASGNSRPTWRMSCRNLSIATVAPSNVSFVVTGEAITKPIVPASFSR